MPSARLGWRRGIGPVANRYWLAGGLGASLPLSLHRSEMSSAAGRPARPMARANSNVVASQLQPVSGTCSPRHGATKASSASVFGADVVSA
jgi:hypothetical protein